MMNETYLNNARHNGTKINENTNQILASLCEIIFLVTGKECNFDILYNGMTIIIREGEENQRYNTCTDAIRALSNIIDTLYA